MAVGQILLVIRASSYTVKKEKKVFQNKVKEGSIRFPLFFVERPLSHVDLCSKFRGLRRLLPFSYLLISQPPLREGGRIQQEKYYLTFIRQIT
jgi:hypothetical protein